MSEPKLISPMLDNFAIGGAISSHHGVSCYPAMENDFDDKYIVKIISVPASQTQLDALLLTGAYTTLESAVSYFKDVADGIIQEYNVLERLSQLEGFLPYRACQCEQKEDGSGYDVYLLSPYRRTLSRQFSRSPLSQLDALNLGLDICAALSVCRRSGYLYVDLKPNNIYISSEKGYYIGDLGFIPLNSLQYASLPEKYRSEYTAPEIEDAFSSLNTTMDVYALGLILYQVYNNGALPQEAEDGTVVPPAYADYEMAEIIMKAISANPDDRWPDPSQMGQALVGYMQRNGANDVPIIPPAPVVSEEDSDSAPVESSEETVQIQDDPVHAPDTEPISLENRDTANLDQLLNEIDHVLDADETSDEDPAQTDAASDVPEEEEFINLSFLDDDSDIDGSEVPYNEISTELSVFLSQADELADHPVPEPVVAPEPIDIPMPEPIIIPVEDEDDAEEDVDLDDLDLTDSDEEDEDTNTSVYGDTEEDEVSEPTKKKRGWIGAVIAIILAAALIVGGYYFYTVYYLQNIYGISTSGTEDRLTVSLQTDTDDTLLTVICEDPHGNRIPAPVANGKAEFSGLLANTTYTVNVEIDGFHKLKGSTTTTYSTPQQTNIVQFSAITGTEDGSVILGITVEGPDSENWFITYSADGEAEEVISFSGHSVTVDNLVIGKEYTFTLSPESDIYMTGVNKITHTARELVFAEQLEVVSFVDGSLSAVWNVPADSSVDSWTVRCSSESFSEVLVTSDPSVTFEGLDHTESYTVEVTAAGMSVSQRALVTADAVTLFDFQVDDTVANQLTVTWSASVDVPEDGWILRTTVDGEEVIMPTVCTENRAVLTDIFPGSTYVFTFESTDGIQFLGLPFVYQTAEAGIYTCNYDDIPLTADDITFRMCRTPSRKNWNRNHLDDDDYTTTFAPGERASFLMHMEKAYGNSLDEVTTSFIIRNANGAPVSIASQVAVWNNMWYRYYGELDIPTLPTAAGEYVLYVYFDGALVCTQAFTITE